MKALLIGSNGYIGRHLAKFLAAQNWQLTLGDFQEKSIDNHSNYQQIDITDKASVEKLDVNVDVVFFFSGLTGTSIGFTKYTDFIKVNEIGLLHLLDTIKNKNSKARFIFPSTRLVYKGIKETMLKEDSEKEFKTIYAINKFACENILKMYRQNFGIDYTVFRICVPYGNTFDHNYSFGTIGFMLRCALNKHNITIFGDGLQRRTFTHVEDICNLIYNAITLAESKNDVFNIGGNNFSLLEAAQLFSKKFGIGIDFKDWPEQELKIESGDTIFDGSKLEALTKYHYLHHLDKWIANW